MKYWRGYLVAFLAAACAWALTLFASSHRNLMDTIYPYVTRMLMDSLAQWSSGVQINLWQLAILVFLVGVLASIVLMIVLRWNPIQWFGWVLAVVSCVNLVQTGLYDLNRYTGSIAEDLRLDDTSYSVVDMQKAARYFLDQANMLSNQQVRGSDGSMETEDFKVLAEQAEAGFHVMVYERSASVLAGCMIPVKELGWADYYTSKGITGMTVGITGESAVNPQVPSVGLPFAICHEMAHRMSIYNNSDADFAAFLACEANPSVQFRYAAFVMAYRNCRNALAQFDTTVAKRALQELEDGIYYKVKTDLQQYDAFLGENASQVSDELCTMLVNWHIQKVILPQQSEDELATLFDPTDETQVDLSGIRTAPTEP